MSETGELKAARKDVRELKAVPADAHMDWCSVSENIGKAGALLAEQEITQYQATHYAPQGEAPH